MNDAKKTRTILVLAGIVCLIFASGVGAMLTDVTATPAVSNAASSTSTEPANQDSSHDLIRANGYYYLFYVTQGYVEYVSSTSMTTWSSPVLLFSADGVNEGQAFSTYYNATSNVIYLVVAGGGLTSFVIRSAVPTSDGTLGSFTTHTYSDGLGFAMNQPSITFDSLGNTIVTYEGVASSGVNVVVDRIAHGTTALTTLATVLSLPPGQTGNDWDGKVYPYGSGVGSGGAFVLVYSSLHSGGSAPPGTTSVWSYLQDYTGSAWLPVVELYTYQEVTHGNGFTVGDEFYYAGQAEVGSEGLFYTHTYNATTPPTQTVIFPNSLGITDGYGSLSWDGQNTIVAYYNSGVEKPYTVWASVSTNLGSSWTSPAVLATSSVKFAPETLGTNLVIKDGVSSVYWGVQPSSGSSTIQVTTINTTLIAPVISAAPTVVDSGQSAELSTATPFSGGTSPYTCQWLAEAPGGNYTDLGTSFSCKVGDTPTASTGTLSTVGIWSFELQVRDDIGIPATSNAVTIATNTALTAPAFSSSSGVIDQGRSSNLTSTAVSTGTSPYTYQWYEEAPGGSFAQIVHGNSTSYEFPTTDLTITGTWSFELGVTDATGSAVNSSAVTVSVNFVLATDAITPSAQTIDSGQSITIAAHPSGGTSPYSYQWYSGASTSCSSDTTMLGAASTQSVSPTSSTYYCYSVTDSASSPSSQSSATDPVTVNSALTPPLVSASSPIDNGQTSAITVSWSGGTSTYTVTVYTAASTSCSGTLTQLGTPRTDMTGKSTNFTESPTTGTSDYCASVTDSAATSVTHMTPSAAAVAVNSSFTGTAVTISPSANIDSGQSVALTVAWTSAGTSPYSVQLATSSSANCASPTPSGSPQNGLAGISTTFSVSPLTTTFYCATVTDTATTPENTFTASAAMVAVGPSLSAGAITPPGPTIDSDQSIALAAAVSGGTSPYSYQWYSGSSATCSSDTTPLGTVSVQSVSPASSTYYCYRVTDSALTPISVISATDLVVVDSVLGTPSLSPSLPSIDDGQSLTITASWSGGTSAYTVELYSGTSSICSSDTTLVSNAPDLSGTSATFSESPTSSSYYCATVIDSAATPSTTTSSADLVTVNMTLGAGPITPSSPTIDAGSSVTLTASPSGGTTPYTYSWWTTPDCSTIHASGSTDSSTYVTSPTLTTTYYYAVTDSSQGTPVTSACSVGDAVTVNPVLVIGAPSGSPSTIDQGQTSSLLATFSGGTSPYTCQWLMEAPDGDTFSDFGGSSSCTSGSVSFAITGSTLNGTYNFELQVTDGASKAATSPAGSVTVDTALGALTIVPSTTTIDHGQAISVTVSWTGGTANYNAGLYSASMSTCSSTSVLVSSQTGLAASPATFSDLSPSSTLYYCAMVTDGAGTPVTTTSSAVRVTVNPAFSAGTISPSSPTIDSGQSVTFAANPSGGTTPYSYQWYTSSDCSGSPISGASSSTYPPSPSSTTTYYVKVTDSATAPASACSSGDTVTVSSPLSAGAVAPSAPTIEGSQSVTLTANPTGGTNPYYYQWYIEASCTAIISGQTGQTYVASPSSTTTYYYKVTDNASTPEVACSAGDTVTVSPALGTLTITPSQTVIDSGQSVSVQVSWYGGASTYSIQLYSSTTSTCTTGSTNVGAQADQTSSPYSFTGLSPAANTWYCATVTDSAATPVTSSVSSFVEVMVNGPLTAGVVTPSAPTTDSGQSVTLTANPSGGITPYTYQWYSGSSATCSSDTTALGVSATQVVSPTSNTYYCYAVADSSADPPTVFSTTDQVTVGSTLIAGAMTPPSPTIDSGQSITLTANPSGGTLSYHYSWWTTSDCFTTPASGSTDSSIYSASTRGTYFYLVTDSASSPVSQCSSGDPVAVAVAFAGTTVTISPSATIDSGQSLTLTVTWTTAGTSPYSVQLTTSSSANCASPAPSGASQTGLTVTSTTFIVSPTSTTLYCATVTDTANSPESASTTSASQIAVNLALTAPSISTTTPTVDSGQSASFSVGWTSGGASPYTVTLYTATSTSCSGALTQVGTSQTGVTSTSTVFTEFPPAGTYNYCASVTDSASTPVTQATTSAAAVTVNSALVAPIISVVPTAIDESQSSTLSTTASFSGGTSTYSCQWLEALGAGGYSDLGSSFSTGCTTSSSPTIPTGALTSGTWHFELQVTDSGNPAELVTSYVVSVTVNAAISLSVPAQTLDIGQSTTLTATASGGSGSYSTYAFYSNTCTGTSLLSSPSDTYSTGDLASTATYCANVTDSLGGTASTTVTVTVGSGPSVSVSPVTVDSAQTATLTAIASGGAGSYVYAWYQGAACSGSVLGTSASYTTSALTSPTTYCAKVTDSLGGIATAASTVTVNPALVVGAITPSSPKIDSGQSITLTGSPSGGTTPYSSQWYTSSSCTTGSISGATGQAYLASPTSTTTYYYKVTDSAYSPVSRCSLGDAVTVHSPLVAGAITLSAQIIDSGQSATLTAHASGGTSPYSYQWYSGSSAICSSDTTSLGTSSTQVVSPTSSTYYCYKVSDASAGTPSGISSSTNLVTVNPALVAGAIIPSVPTTDSGQSITLSSAASGGTTPYTYQWYTGASCATTISGQTLSTYSPSPTSTTTYSYKVTDAANSRVSQCSSGDTVTVNHALVAGAITPSSPAIDSGQSITLTAHPSGGTSPYSYHWYSGSSATCSSDITLLSSTASTQSVNPTANTYYCYSVTDGASSPSSKSSLTDLVTVHAALTAGAITPLAPKVIVGKSTTLTAHPSGGTSPYLYQWYSGSSSTCSSDTTALGTASTQSVSPTSSTYYCYTVSDSATGTPVAGATSSAIQVTVNKATTTTQVTCNSPVVVGMPSTCVVTVTGAYGSTNGETVSFQASGSGTFSSGATCTLTGGTCSLTYTPTKVSGRAQIITATYSGDTNNAGSSGQASVTVT